MKESDFINVVSSYSDEKLRLALNEINTMNSSDIIALKQEFMNREMFEQSFVIDTLLSDQFDPSKLTLREIQQLVSDRLQTGEQIESIKLDLADHGITLAELINNEGERIDTVFEKIASAPYKGINKERIHEELKNEYNYTDQEIVEVKMNLKKRSVFYKISGVCIVLVSIIYFFIALWLGAVTSSLTVVGVGLYSNGVRLSGK